jgi:hypothetical protein
MCLHGTVYMYRSRILWMYILYILCIHAKRFGFPCKLSTWGIFFYVQQVQPCVYDACSFTCRFHLAACLPNNSS